MHHVLERTGREDLSNAAPSLALLCNSAWTAIGYYTQSNLAVHWELLCILWSCQLSKLICYFSEICVAFCFKCICLYSTLMCFDSVSTGHICVHWLQLSVGYWKVIVNNACLAILRHHTTVVTPLTFHCVCCCRSFIWLNAGVIRLNEHTSNPCGH